MYVNSKIRLDDEGHDQIGSASVTPSGVATPRPDPSDKRLPGISNSYFGQVGYQSSIVLSFPHSCQRPAVGPVMDVKSRHEGPEPDGLDNGHLIRSKWPSLQNPAIQSQGSSGTPWSASGHLSNGFRQMAAQLPTPPSSTASPSRRTRSQSSEHSERQQRSVSSGALKSPVNNAERACSAMANAGDIPSIEQPTTVPPVPESLTVDKANPVTTHFSRSTIPSASSNFSSTTLSSLTSHFALTRMTDKSCVKNTPPLTPRALSSDGSHKRPSATSLDSAHDRELSPSDAHGARNGVRSSPKISTPVRLPKGKLRVRILEGRGLRPSTDPYAVCVFEWNESIAQDSTISHPRPCREDSMGSSVSLGGLGSVPMKRSGSDMGRSIAIPMKSRQGSTTSLSDQKSFKAAHQVTNPRWDHEATLLVNFGTTAIPRLC